MDDCDQITINIIPDQSVDINAITLNQGIINHSVTHQSGGSDELLHNLLGGLQGGSGNGYYHLSSGQYFNLTTGEVVRPSETGIFYTNNNPSGFITGVDLSSYATIVYTTGISGDLQDQIIILNNQTGTYITGSVVRPNETGIFITNSQTGQFYANSNPSGFITGIDLSAYSTITYVTGVSGNLQNQINILNNQTGSYVLDSETGNFITAAQTGGFYPISNPSGYITGISNLVFTTGNQTISGLKTFANNLTVNGNDLFVDTSNNRVGIGTASPITTLDVNGSGLFRSGLNVNSIIGTGSLFNISNIDNAFNIFANNSGGGNIELTAGSGTYAGGSVTLKGGSSASQGGNILLRGGSVSNSSVPEGFIRLESKNITFNQQNNYSSNVIFWKTGLSTISESIKISQDFISINNNLLITGSRPTVNSTGVLLSGEATTQDYVTGISGHLQTQITTLNNQTGSYVLNSETGSFITNSQTGDFYSSSNPSGYITGVDLSFSGNYYTKDESESRYVNTTGAETILGDKTFHDKVYINNLYVTGLETIVNTTNTNVASNYIMLNLTGGAVDGGIFFVTGSGLTGINDSGAIIGFDHSDKFKFGIGTRADDLSTLNTIASEQQLTGASGYLQTQIITLNNQTGDYALNINTGNFITSSQTGQFYASSNPSGFITGVDLSAYVLNSETGNFITNSQTGEFYSNSNPSGFITGINNLVYTTGDQIISGSKTFDFRPNVNGTGILLSGEAAQLPETIIYSTGDQNISGIKTFNDLPNIPITPISGNNPTSKEYVDTLISGVNLSIQDYLVSISTNSLSSFTLGSGDNNKVIQCTSTTGITVTLPNSLPQGFNCVLIQSNSGQINIQGESGVAVGSFGNLVKTAGQHAPVSIICLASGIYNIAGNLI